MAKKPKPNGASEAPAPHLTDPQLTGRLMRQQAGLGLRVAAVFLILILGMPLLNALAPDFTRQQIMGFPLYWFVLGLAFYPVSWALSVYFVKASEKLEHEEAWMFRSEKPE
jgi:hypothetical protein